MKHTAKEILFLRRIASALCAACLCVSLVTVYVFARQKQDAGADKSKGQPPEIALFDKRVKQYVKLREGLEEKLPKLSKEAKPEEIETHKAKFKEVVRAARTGARRGDVFTPDVADYFRATIRAEFKGEDRKELLKTVLGAENKDVPLRVNYPYPESKELTEIPPTLLLALPQLPKQLRYRFVGRNLLLVDRENDLIVDYMLNALP